MDPSQRTLGAFPRVREASSKCLMAPEAPELLTMALSSSLGSGYHFIREPLYLRTCLPLPAGFCLEEAPGTREVTLWKLLSLFLWINALVS